MQGGKDIKDEQAVFDEAAELIREGKNAEAKSILKDSKLHRRSGGSDNMTLLHVAAEAGNDDMTKHLLALGSDVDAKTTSGSTPIMLAKEKKRKSVVEILAWKDLQNIGKKIAEFLDKNPGFVEQESKAIAYCKSKK